jgi:predicted dehydrogenase
LRIHDKREKELPDIGLVRVLDAETGQLKWIDTSSRSLRKMYEIENLKFEHRLKDMFNRSGVDAVSIATSENYIKPLMNLFKKREGHR